MMMTTLPGARPPLPSPGAGRKVSGETVRIHAFRALRSAGMPALVGLLAFGMIPPARAGARQLAASTAQYTLVSLELDPDRVAGGRPVTGTVRLNLPALA